MKKCQVAMEYIVTYGWALLAVTVLVAGLSFFGIFNPEDSLPDNCFISSDIECKDYRIHVVEESGIPNEYVEVYVRNLNRQDLYVNRVECSIGSEHSRSITESFDNTTEINGNIVGYLPTNRYIKIVCGGEPSEDIASQGSKFKAKMYLEIFTENSFPQQVVGEIITKVQ